MVATRTCSARGCGVGRACRYNQVVFKQRLKLTMYHTDGGVVWWWWWCVCVCVMGGRACCLHAIRQCTALHDTRFATGRRLVGSSARLPPPWWPSGCHLPGLTPPKTHDRAARVHGKNGRMLWLKLSPRRWDGWVSARPRLRWQLPARRRPTHSPSPKTVVA